MKKLTLLKENMSYMTYGTLPDKNEFDNHYQSKVGNRDYHMELNKNDFNVFTNYLVRINRQKHMEAMKNRTFKQKTDLSKDELYRFIELIVEDLELGNIDLDEVGTNLASSILETLGFEWI